MVILIPKTTTNTLKMNVTKKYTTIFSHIIRRICRFKYINTYLNIEKILDFTSIKTFNKYISMCQVSLSLWQYNPAENLKKACLHLYFYYLIFKSKVANITRQSSPSMRRREQEEPCCLSVTVYHAWREAYITNCNL